MRENAPTMAGDDDADDVLARLPKTRPARRSARRDAPQTAKRAPAKRAAKPAAKPPTSVRPAPEPQPPARGPIEPPTAGEIVHTAVAAAGDLARVGLLVGRELLKAVRSRLPGM